MHGPYAWNSRAERVRGLEGNETVLEHLAQHAFPERSLPRVSLEFIRSTTMGMLPAIADWTALEYLAGRGEVLFSDKVGVWDEHRHLTCGSTDKLHKELMAPGSKHYRQGVLLYLEGTLLGQMKFKGNDTFLAYLTVQKSDGTFPLVRGGIYTLDPHVEDKANADFPEAGHWARMDIGELEIGDLQVVPHRFIRVWPTDSLWYGRSVHEAIASMTGKKDSIAEGLPSPAALPDAVDMQILRKV